MGKPCVLFDLDGTLLNTNELVLESLQYTIRTHLGIDADAPRLYKYFGQPLVTIMADLSPDKADELVRTYREYSARKHDDLIRVFPHVPETLDKLKSSDVPVAVVTSKLRSLAFRGLKLCNLEKYIDACVAFEDTDNHKPEPDPIVRALEMLGIEPAIREVIMVGDSPYDLLCASNAGVKSAAVEWSIHPREVLSSCKPDIWLPDFPALLDYL